MYLLEYQDFREVFTVCALPICANNQKPNTQYNFVAEKK